LVRHRTGASAHIGRYRVPPTRRAVTVGNEAPPAGWQARCPTGQTRHLSPGPCDAQQRHDAVIGTRPPNASGRARLPLVTRFLPALTLLAGWHTWRTGPWGRWARPRRPRTTPAGPTGLRWRRRPPTCSSSAPTGPSWPGDRDAGRRGDCVPHAAGSAGGPRRRPGVGKLTSVRLRRNQRNWDRPFPLVEALKNTRAVCAGA